MNHSLRCPREVRHFDCEADKFRFILAVNAHRRPCLDSKQKRAVIEGYLQGDSEIANNTLAQALGVSKNTVAKVRCRLEDLGTLPKVQKSRGKDRKLRPVKYTKRIITHTPREFEEAQEIVKELPDACAGKVLDMTTATRRVKRNKKKEEKVQQILPPLHEEAIRIYHCPFQELEEAAGLTPGSANLVVTDVPFEEQFLPQLDALGQLTQRLLVDGGVFVLQIGQGYLNRVMKILDQYLTYRWTAGFFWGGDANMFYPLKVASQWKPLLLYSKGPWERQGRWPDVIRDPSKDKHWHEWQQPFAVVEQFVSFFSQAGDLVVDPCGGGFTTAEVCFRLSRKCVSCDISEACVANGLERLEQAKRRLSSQTGAL